MTTLREAPLKRAEGYTMDLYCRYTGDYAHDTKTHGAVFYGRSQSEVHRDARAAGWILHRDGTASCPACVKEHGLR